MCLTVRAPSLQAHLSGRGFEIVFQFRLEYIYNSSKGSPHCTTTSTLVCVQAHCFGIVALLANWYRRQQCIARRRWKIGLDLAAVPQTKDLAVTVSSFCSTAICIQQEPCTTQCTCCLYKFASERKKVCCHYERCCHLYWRKSAFKVPDHETSVSGQLSLACLL